MTPRSTILLLLAALLLPAALAAQTVRGQLVEEGSLAPIDGALIVAIDAAGNQRAGSLSNAAGRFEIRLPEPGRYRLRAERIGFRSVVSELLTVDADGVVEHRLVAPATAVSLAGIEVRAQRRCFVRPQDGLLVATLWEEARKALNAAAWTEREGLVRYRAVRYIRDLDARTQRVEQEQTRSWWGGDSSPFVSLPVEDLLRDGYVRVDGDSLVYLAPDADVLLSNHFLDAYCFRVADQEGDLVGIAFEPVRRRSTPDVRGVLWIDRSTAELRRLEYSYTRVPGVSRVSAGGEVEFQRLPTGAWLVRRWTIRIPLLAEQTHRSGTADIRRQVVVRVREEGGELVEIHAAGGGRLAASRRAVVEGVVFDSIANVPLAGAHVFLDGTSYETTSDADGRFRMEDLPAGRYHAAFLHPRLDSLDLLPQRREVELSLEAPAQIELAIPSRLGLLAQRCEAQQRDLGTGAVVGIVRNDVLDLPLAGVEVVVSWPGGRASSVTDAHGAYRVCVAPLGAPLTVAAQVPRGYTRIAGGEEGRIDLRLEAETVAFQDLGLSIAHTVARSPQQTFATAAGRTEVRGRLLDAESGAPIQGAVVRIDGVGTAQTTDRQGRFFLRELTPGAHSLEVQHLAYGTASRPLSVGGGGIVEVELRLAQTAIDVPGLTVVARSAADEIRRRSGTRSDLFTRDELAEFERTAQHMGDVVRRFPGLRVREVRTESALLTGLCIESVRSQPPGGGPECRPVKVYIDDMWYPDGMQRLASLPINHIESVQYLPGHLALARYGTGAEFGVLLLYTRGLGPTATPLR
jgi:hypothetical protein